MSVPQHLSEPLKFFKNTRKVLKERKAINTTFSFLKGLWQGHANQGLPEKSSKSLSRKHYG